MRKWTPKPRGRFGFDLCLRLANGGVSIEQVHGNADNLAVQGKVIDNPVGPVAYLTPPLGIFYWELVAMAVMRSKGR